MQENYTPEQWELLMDAPQIMALGVALMDGGAVGFGRELVALTTFHTQAKQVYEHNALITAALDATPLEDDLKASKYLDAGKYNTLVFLQMFQQIAALLQNTQEHHEYKVFLIQLGAHIAQAAGAGLFGMGEKISEEEMTFIVQVRHILGV